MTSESDSQSRRRPPTIDLTATEVKNEQAAPDAGAAVKPRAGGSFGGAVGALVGAVVVAAIGAGLWFAGVVPAAERSARACAGERRDERNLRAAQSNSGRAGGASGRRPIARSTPASRRSTRRSKHWAISLPRQTAGSTVSRWRRKARASTPMRLSLPHKLPASAPTKPQLQ